MAKNAPDEYVFRKQNVWSHVLHGQITNKGTSHPLDVSENGGGFVIVEEFLGGFYQDGHLACLSSVDVHDLGPRSSHKGSLLLSQTTM